MSRKPRQFATRATLVALGGLVVLLAASAPWAAGVRGWLVLGWGLMATIAVAAGYRLVERHAREGHGFMIALVGGMVARVLAAGLAGLAAVPSGERAVWALVAGLAAGFLPVQVYEMLWFARHLPASPVESR